MNTEIYFACDENAFKCRMVVYDPVQKVLAKISGFKWKGGGYRFKTSVYEDSSRFSANKKVVAENVKVMDADAVSELNEFESVSLMQAVRHSSWFVNPENFAVKKQFHSKVAKDLVEVSGLVRGQYPTLHIDRLPLAAKAFGAGVKAVRTVNCKIARCINNVGFEHRLILKEFYRIISFTDDPSYIIVEDNRGDTIIVAKTRFEQTMQLSDMEVV